MPTPVLLGSDERQLWKGQPRQGMFLRRSDALAIPFSLMWGGFAIFWEYGVLTSPAPGFFALWGVPFVAIGLYMFFGRFFYDARRRAATQYVVSNERVLIITDLFGSRTTSLDLRNLADLSLETDGSGNGTIYFVNPSLSRSRNASFGAPAVPCFELGSNARSVYEAIRQAQREAR